MVSMRSVEDYLQDLEAQGPPPSYPTTTEPQASTTPKSKAPLKAGPSRPATPPTSQAGPSRPTTQQGRKLFKIKVNTKSTPTRASRDQRRAPPTSEAGLNLLIQMFTFFEFLAFIVASIWLTRSYKFKVEERTPVNLLVRVLIPTLYVTAVVGYGQMLTPKWADKATELCIAANMIFFALAACIVIGTTPCRAVGLH